MTSTLGLELTPCIALRKTFACSSQCYIIRTHYFSLIVAVNVMVREYRKLICLQDMIDPFQIQYSISLTLIVF